MSDTTQFDMRDTFLKPALEIAFATSPNGKAWGYKSTKDTLVFAWNKAAGKNFVPFVTPIGPEQAYDIVKSWCEEVADYGKEPHWDGESKKSHRVYCEDWGHVEGNAYAFVAIQPYWAVYGK